MKKIFVSIGILLCVIQYSYCVVVENTDTVWVERVEKDFSRNDILIYVDKMCMDGLISIYKAYGNDPDKPVDFCDGENELYDLWQALCRGKEKCCTMYQANFSLYKDSKPLKNYILVQSLKPIPVCKIQKIFDCDAVKKICVARSFESE